MGPIEVIDELTDICIRQAETIKALIYQQEQTGAIVNEEEAVKTIKRLRELVGEWEI